MPALAHPVDAAAAYGEAVVVAPASMEASAGPQVGARVGYWGGAGVVYSGLNLNDATSGAIPVIIDVGWRFLPRLYAGVYGQLAPVLTKANPLSCPDGTSCSAQDYRIGLEVDYHFAPSSRVDPYVGASGGYEWLQMNVGGGTTVPTSVGAQPGSVNASVTDRGWEMAALTLGVDVRPSRGVAVGPFVTGTLGEFNVRTGTQTVTVAAAVVQSTPVPDVNHGLHELLIAGLRGTFNP
jgi:hypothetical protein